MLNTDQAVTYWRNVHKMPFLLQMFCCGSIVGVLALPIFLILAPSAVWMINGRTMSSAELWSTGNAVAIAAFLPFYIFGVWGLIARKHASRWLLIFSPFVPYIFLAALPVNSPAGFNEAINAALSAAFLYAFFFHIRANREYFDDKDVGA